MLALRFNLRAQLGVRDDNPAATIWNSGMASRDGQMTAAGRRLDEMLELPYPEDAEPRIDFEPG